MCRLREGMVLLSMRQEVRRAALYFDILDARKFHCDEFDSFEHA